MPKKIAKISFAPLAWRQIAQFRLFVSPRGFAPSGKTTAGAHVLPLYIEHIIGLFCLFCFFFVFSFLLDKSIYTIFIDGTDEEVEGTFVTSKDGTPITYTNFYPGQPDNYNGVEDCIVMYKFNKKWKDLRCSFPQASVCEIPWWGNE